MDAFQEVENLGNSWIINHHNNFNIDFNYNGNDDFIKILLSVINLAYFDNKLNIKFNFQINNSDQFEFYIESLNYAFSSIHNINQNYINNNSIKTFIFLWNNLINYNNDNKNNYDIIKDNIIQFIKYSDINSNFETLEISNLMNILNINFNNYIFEDYKRIYNYIKLFKTKMIKDASIINREIFNKFRILNNWIDNSNVNNKHYVSHNKYDFKYILKYNEKYNIKSISWSKAKRFYNNNNYNKIYFNNIKIKFENYKNISNILGFKRNTIIKWKRNNFINDIFDIKYYMDKEWKNQTNINNNNNYNNKYQIRAGLNNNLRNYNRTNYIYNLKNYYFKSDLVLNNNTNHNITNIHEDNIMKDHKFYKEINYRSKSPD